MKPLQKDLPELVRQNVISQDVADRINQYYIQKSELSPNRLVLVFGILGALLTGLGIILIIAHNWDELSKAVKLFFALLPLLLGQALCAYSLWKQKGSRVWSESSAVFLLFAIAASISIVSQVYNIHGSLARFLLVWMILSIPVIYVMRSSMTSLLVICGITWYACERSYWGYPTGIAWLYWPLLVSMLPYYYQLKKSASTNFITFHSWLLPVSLIITLGMFGESDGQWLVVAYMALFSALVLLGGTDFFKTEKLRNNGVLITGSLGSIILLMILSFDWFWEEMDQVTMDSREAVVAVVLSAIASILLVYQLKERKTSVNPKGALFLALIFLLPLGTASPGTAQIVINLLILVIAIVTIRSGAEQDRLLVLNYGLMIIATLVICRFFDTDLSFVLRGLLFIAVGAGFFGANYWMMKKRKSANV